MFSPLANLLNTTVKYIYITKTGLFKYTEILPLKKKKKKKSDILHISAQNIDCGYR